MAQAYFWVTAVKSRNVTVASFYKRYCESAELDFKRDNETLLFYGIASVHSIYILLIVVNKH